jgi:hypothetical protein
MSKKAHDIFALVINFFGVDWQPKHIIIGLFHTSETTRQVLAKNVITLLDEYGFFIKIVVYVKDEGANLNVLTMALKFVVSCEIFGLNESF